MSAEAWAAFIDSLINALLPIFWGGVAGWMLRGASDARKRLSISRKNENEEA